MAAFGIGYQLCKEYELDGISGVALSTMAFVVTQLNDKCIIDPSGFDSSDLFTAIISGVIASEIYHYCISKNWVIKLPNGVPLAVSNLFVSLFPALITLFLFWLVRVPLHININEVVQSIFSPLLFALNSLPGILIYTLFVSLLWCAGIHGDMILEGVSDPIFIQFLASNTEAFARHQALPFITASGFSSLFVNVGGTGATLTLVLLMLASRSKTYKQLGKLSLPGALFEINEPVTMVPWTMPPIILDH